MSAIRASLFATLAASSTSRRAERGCARAASVGDAGVGRGRRDVLLGICLGTFCPNARADNASAPDAPRRPASCATGTSCVSTSAFRTPANYLPPWEYLGDDTAAFKSLEKLLVEKAQPGSVYADETTGFIRADLKYPDGVDTYEFHFKNDGSRIVLFSARSQTNKVSPPGCFQKGCINGPRNRARAEALRDEIGWLGFETDEDKKWVPLLLH